MTNPLLVPWTGPFGGVPAFHTIRVSDFAPAIESAMASQLTELAVIAENPAPATFENTLLALEKSGQPLARAMALYGVWSGGLSTPEFRAVETELSPKLAAFTDSIFQDVKLFARLKAVYESPGKAQLTVEQQRLCWHWFNAFAKEGANLDAAQKTQLSQYNRRIAELSTQFSQNQLADEENEVLVIDERAGLAGLSEAQVSSAAEEAARRGLTGKWAIANTRSAMEPFLITASNRALRERGFGMWTRRGDNGNAHDNNALVTELLTVRAKKAKLLGYPSYAHWSMSDTMAREPQRALDLMFAVWRPAVAQFKADVLEAQAIADAEGAGIQLEPWDYRYYAEKLRKAKYDLDLEEVKPWLQLDRIREAMFQVALKLYEFTFTRVEGVPVFNADMSVYDVTRGGAHVGLWYFDPYARQGKQSGAWMSAYRDQRHLEQPISTLVSNNSNFIKPAPGEPVLLSWDDARTMFHEFGHALHGLNSQVTYPTLSGTNTTRDFVEFPSQFHENFLSTPEVLQHLVNAKGERIPESLLTRIEQARTFNEGFSTAEAQASAIVDMKLHLAGDAPIDPRAFERDALAELGMPPQLVMRHRIPAFGHIFAGGYAAGYYSYLWAEVLERDAYEAFLEASGPYDAQVARRFQQTIMSVGNTVDPEQAFRDFRGRDPRPDALLRAKGFPVPPAR